MGMQEPGISADLCQSADWSPLLLSAYPPPFLPEQHFQSCSEANTPDSLSRPISDSQDRNKKEASAQVEKSLRGLPHHPSTH